MKKSKRKSENISKIKIKYNFPKSIGYRKCSSKAEVIVIQAYLKKQENLEQPNLPSKEIRRTTNTAQSQHKKEILEQKQMKQRLKRK